MMELMKFPYVVQRHIIKQMAHGEALLLSFVSRESMEMVRSVCWRDTKHINYRLADGFLSVIIGRRHNPTGEIWGFRPISRVFAKKIDFQFPGSDVKCT
uniref:F-box domain-containing protein n=1 Tax=Caenorhabditis tropicalis TaxID=1561998 RepID=A0A1I7TR12_9PELO